MSHTFQFIIRAHSSVAFKLNGINKIPTVTCNQRQCVFTNFIKYFNPFTQSFYCRFSNWSGKITLYNCTMISQAHTPTCTDIFRVCLWVCSVTKRKMERKIESGMSKWMVVPLCRFEGRGQAIRNKTINEKWKVIFKKCTHANLVSNLGGKLYKHLSSDTNKHVYVAYWGWHVNGIFIFQVKLLLAISCRKRRKQLEDCF